MLTTGTRLGPYEIVAPLGAGGMGEVYRARDTRLGRDVAVKVLPAAFSADPERLRRFEQEARAAGVLNHPNILAIYDIGTHDGAPYIVAELLEGETLRARMAGAALPVRKAIDAALQVARGLAAAHEKGIVHRDLKPENLFVTKDGRVKILDFGLAKLTRAGDEDSTRSQSPTIGDETGAGIVLGTAGYMSPEQVRGKPADHRSDLFAFGSILYEMLSGTRPFRGETSAETMTAILREEPPDLIATHPEMPPAVDRIVRHCLEKSPEERFQSAREVAFYLESLSGLSGSATTIGGAAAATSGSIGALLPHARARRAVPLPAAIALGALIAIAALLVGRRLGGSGGSAARNAGAAFTQLTDQTGVESTPSLSPDGSSVAYTKWSADIGDVFMQRIGGQNPINLTKDSPASDEAPAFSPDGRLIAFRSSRDGGGIFLMGATGESVRRLTDFGYDPAWSPDGKEIVCTSEGPRNPMDRPSRSQMWIVRVDTGSKRLFFAGDAVQPAWSPHGQRIAYWGIQDAGSQRDIWTIAVRESARAADTAPVTSDAAVDWNPVWSPDGKFLYFSSDRGGTMNVWRVAIDEESGKLLGEPEPLTTPSGFSGWLAVSRDGRSLAYTALEKRTELRKIAFDTARGTVTGQPTSITRGSRILTYLDASPDGESVAMTSAGSYEDLCIVEADGSGTRRLMDDRFKDRHPRWSPDGKRIAFYSDRSGVYDIWCINADGSGLVQLTKNTGSDSYLFPLWCPNRPLIAFSSRSGCFTIDLEKPLEQRAATPLPAINDSGDVFFAFDWSPDGRFLSGNARRVGRTTERGAVVYSLDSQKYERLTTTGANSRWLSDSRRLVFADSGKLLLLDCRTKTTHETLALEPEVFLLDFSLTPDDRTLYWVQSTLEADIWMMRLAGDAGDRAAGEGGDGVESVRK